MGADTIVSRIATTYYTPCCLIQNAASIAALVLTTESLVSVIPEPPVGDNLAPHAIC